MIDIKVWLIKLIKNIIGFTLLLSLSACLKNTQLRTEYVDGNCLWGEVDCSQSMIEQYGEYDLTFIEFTERGNLFMAGNITQKLMIVTCVNFVSFYQEQLKIK